MNSLIPIAAVMAIVIFILIKHRENRRVEDRRVRMKEKEEALLELLRKKKNENVN